MDGVPTSPVVQEAVRDNVATFQALSRTRFEQVQKVIKFIQTDPCNKDLSEKLGYVYAFAIQEGEDCYVKVGYSTDEGQRALAARKCVHDYSELYNTNKFKWSFKCEQIVHRIHAESCHPRRNCECSANVEAHWEWFKLDVSSIVSTISLVRNWMSRDPYEVYTKMITKNNSPQKEERSARLKAEWVAALDIFQKSQKTSQPMDWAEFFGAGVQTRSNPKTLQQSPGILKSSWSSPPPIIQLTINNTPPKHRYISRSGNSLARRLLLKSSTSSPSTPQPSTKFKSERQHSSTPRMKSDGPKTAPPTALTTRSQQESNSSTPSRTPRHLDTESSPFSLDTPTKSTNLRRFSGLRGKNKKSLYDLGANHHTKPLEDDVEADTLTDPGETSTTDSVISDEEDALQGKPESESQEEDHFTNTTSTRSSWTTDEDSGPIQGEENGIVSPSSVATPRDELTSVVSSLSINDDILPSEAASEPRPRRSPRLAAFRARKSIEEITESEHSSALPLPNTVPRTSRRGHNRRASVEPSKGDPDELCASRSQHPSSSPFTDRPRGKTNTKPATSPNLNFLQPPSSRHQRRASAPVKINVTEPPDEAGSNQSP
ncbi:uncharacterized protein Z518_05877 [Rhinocladiella mackenziei CBS 650.93]|uniref:Bacteriophage T5 Orf172 DNA-binding domain-containing protein n=1 Tax=Rhinocladiella mackenziei CBS 650.93 TaxID=1442369 RepID=A0A0D2J7K2_9EURO|nr:uncharacterized protein Z518_05877 [Rhinocladiella mackenziei CBS 650.93]KIX05005.1 hypothetical protein Z518_05877 [Rhinocladiella mackenziei CBS 650.93]